MKLIGNLMVARAVPVQLFTDFSLDLKDESLKSLQGPFFYFESKFTRCFVHWTNE